MTGEDKKYSKEVYDLILRAAAALYMFDQYLGRILKLVPDLNTHEFSETVMYAKSLFEKSERRKAKKGAQPRMHDRSLDPGTGTPIHAAECTGLHNHIGV